MKTMTKNTLFIPLLMAQILAVSGSAYAATQEQIAQAKITGDQVLQQQQSRLEEQQNKLTPIETPSGVDLSTQFELSNSLIDANVQCIELDAIKIDGATLLDEWEVEVLEVPFVGKCINSELVAAALSSATNFYIQRGFVTTRAYLPNQNLKQGILRLVIAEGMVETVVVEGSSDSVNLAAAFPIDMQEPLHIRDLEQAVEQLNAVPGNDVIMEIIPGATPDKSDVVFTNSGTGNPRGTITLNNGGSKATGENILSIVAAAGDLLNVSDVWSVSGSESSNGVDGSTNSAGLDIKIPHGYNTYGVGATGSSYKTVLTFPTTGTVLTSSGATQGFNLSAQRLVFRDQDTKHSVGAVWNNSATQSYIGGQRIEVNSRTVNTLKFYGQSLFGFGDKMLVVSPEVEVGLSEVDNLPTGANTPVENPQTEFVRYKIRLDWSQPASFAGLPIRWKSAFNYQYSPDSLYGSQQISIGGIGSVRGFKGVSLSGDQGYFWQNSLVLNQNIDFGSLSGAMQYTVGYDLGEVSSSLDGSYTGGMQGMFIEASFKMDNWRLGVSWSNPIHVNTDLDKGDSSVLATLSLDL